MLAYKSRLYPNKQQEQKLLYTFELCCRAHNQMLEEHKSGLHSYNGMGKFLTQLKKEMPDLNEVHSKCLQPERDKLFANLAALKEMRKSGRKVGKLRFKSEQRFRTFTYNQSGFKLLPKNDKFSFLHFSKIGDIPIRIHCEVKGEIKGITIKHFPSGKWYAYLLVDDGLSFDELTVIDKAVGLDVSLQSCILDSDGQELENPRHLKHELK